MKGNKPQFSPRKRNYMDRAVDTTETRQRFLIVCEGEKTEPKYFEQFRVPGLVIEVQGIGRNTISLVKEALKLREADEYDQVWCVFDKDDFPVEQFETAIQRALDNGLRVAYSNQAFELWYVLHFEYLHTAIDRNAYMKKLGGYLGFEYKKNNPNMYRLLFAKKDTAIRNARQLLQEYQPSRPSRDDPSTCVHELVLALSEQSRPLSRRSTL